jgi:hypothetical protein
MEKTASREDIKTSAKIKTKSYHGWEKIRRRGNTWPSSFSSSEKEEVPYVTRHKKWTTQKQRVIKNEDPVHLDSSNILSKGRTNQNQTNQQPHKILKDKASFQDGHSSKDTDGDKNKRHRVADT